MRNKGLIIKIILPLLVLGVGFLVMRTLTLNRQHPKKQAVSNIGVLVETVPVSVQDRQLKISATGTVRAAQEISVTMQVSGRIFEMSPDFVAGGFFKKGELLFAVESVDYETTVELARAAYIKMKNELVVVDGKARIARSEWEKMKDAVGGEPNPLVLYEPQLENARAGLAAAAATLKQAEIDLARTRVVAPFDCRVRSEEIGPGQYVRAGSSVAVLDATGVAEIVVPLQLEDISWVSIPEQGSGRRGSEVEIRITVSDKTHRWRGYIARSLGEIDAKSRMAGVVIRVDDPYDGPESDFDLAVGLFVDIVINGRVLNDVVVLPRKALREKSTVWLMDQENKLRVRPVSPVRVEEDDVLIAKGLAVGDLVVVTALSGAADGMLLRALTDKESEQ